MLATRRHAFTRASLTLSSSLAAVTLIALAGCGGHHGGFSGLAATSTAPVVRQLRTQGDGQSAVAGTALAAPLAVQAFDRTGNGVPGAQISFAVTEGTGHLSVTQVLTDANGRAQTSLTVGLGANTVVASLAGASLTATFHATGDPVPPSSNSPRSNSSNNNGSGGSSSGTGTGTGAGTGTGSGTGTGTTPGPVALASTSNDQQTGTVGTSLGSRSA